VNSEFITLEGKSRDYRNMVAILGVLTLAGLVAFIISYILGHQTFGSSNTVPWGMPIVLAIYLIGLSAGSLILSSLTYVFGREEYKPIARVAVFLAIVLIFGAMLSIAIDLGRPEKAWRLFMFFYMNNMKSMFAINGILYGGYFVISLIYLGIIFAGRPAATKITGTIAVGWAVLVHMGTGAIFGFIAAREAWVSPIKPFEFLAAALTSGLALLIVAVILTLKLSGRVVKKELIASLGRMLVAFIGILLLLIIVDKLTHLYVPHREATLYMLAGRYAWIFWAFQIGLGVVIPLAILLNKRLNRTTGWVALAAASVVVGVFFERYYLVFPGAAYPQQYYPGEIEGVWGATGSFTLAPTEIILSAGIICLLALVYVLGLKFLELLPVKAPDEKTEEIPSTEPNQAAAEENKEAPETTGEAAGGTVAENE
jgi:Ni/Fe-hydrogenase subunit HybB-like protein